MPTAFLTHPLFERHEVPEGHPERPQRLSAIRDELITQGIYDLLRVTEAPEASYDALYRVHEPGYVSMLEHFEPAEGLVSIDPDTFIGPHSLAAALHAAGAAVEATDLVGGRRVGFSMAGSPRPGLGRRAHASRGVSSSRSDRGYAEQGWM